MSDHSRDDDIPADDRWAYTPEHRAALLRAHADSRAGRVRRLTEEELRTLGDQAPSPPGQRTR